MRTNSAFSLIKSLTNNEKRYIRRNFTISQKNTRYTKLFDLLDAQKAYEPKEIKLKYKSSNFSGDCKYLFEQTLAYLMRFHGSTNNALHLNNEYQKAILLNEKKLFKEAEKKCLTAQKTFDVIANPMHHLLFSHFISSHLNSHFNYSNADDFENIENNYQLAKSQLNNMYVVIELKHVYDTLAMSAIFSAPYKPNSNALKKLIDVLKSSGFTQKLKECDELTQLLYAKVLWFYYHRANNNNKMLWYAKKAFTVVRDNPKLQHTKLGLTAVKQMLGTAVVMEDAKGFLSAWYEIETKFENGENILNIYFDFLVSLAVSSNMQNQNELQHLMKTRTKAALTKLDPHGLFATYRCFCMFYYYKKEYSNFLLYYAKLKAHEFYNNLKVFLAAEFIVIEIMRMVIYAATSDFKALQHAILDFKDQKELVKEHPFVSNHVMELFEKILANPKNKAELLNEFSNWYNDVTETRLNVFRKVKESSLNIEKHLNK